MPVAGGTMVQPFNKTGTSTLRTQLFVYRLFHNQNGIGSKAPASRHHRRALYSLPGLKSSDGPIRPLEMQTFVKGRTIADTGIDEPKNGTVVIDIRHSARKLCRLIRRTKIGNSTTNPFKHPNLDECRKDNSNKLSCAMSVSNTSVCRVQQSAYQRKRPWLRHSCTVQS